MLRSGGNSPSRGRGIVGYTEQPGGDGVVWGIGIVETHGCASLQMGLNEKSPPEKSEGLYGIGRRPTLPPVGQYHRRGRA